MSFQNNIDLNAIDIHGLTPLVKLCIYGHNYVVKLLLDHSESRNIDLNSRDIGG